MKTTIDKAGRLVIPQALRESLGLRPGIVEVHAVGADIVVRVPVEEALVERDGRLLIGSSGAAVDDDLVHTLRDAGQK